MLKKQTHPSSIKKERKKKKKKQERKYLHQLAWIKVFQRYENAAGHIQKFNGSRLHVRTEMINIIEQIWKEYVKKLTTTWKPRE